jgi:copper chaperone CopZ
MTERTFHVTGLDTTTEEAIARILNAINGVDGVHTDPAEATITVELDEDVPEEMLRAAVEGAGIHVIDA